jgi:hypothetical protein
VVKLVDQRFLIVDELVDDLHEWRDLGGARLVDILKDLTVPETFLVTVNDLVDTGVAVLEEPVGVVRRRSPAFMVTLPRLKAFPRQL